MKTLLQQSAGSRRVNYPETKSCPLGRAIWLAVLLAHLGLASAQTPAELDLQLYAGLTITGAVGTVYSVEYVTDLAETNNASAWRCLEFLQLPASPYLWVIGSIGRWSSQRPRTWCSSHRGRSGWAARRTKWTARKARVRRRR
jgi:hypothetical protein